MRRWLYKTDEAGKPRRFLDHREAALWALTTVGKVFGIFALYFSASFVVDAFGEAEFGNLGLALVPAAMIALAWLFISLVLYLYVTLSGGVMDNEARRRYRNNETLTR